MSKGKEHWIKEWIKLGLSRSNAKARVEKISAASKNRKVIKREKKK